GRAELQGHPSLGSRCDAAGLGGDATTLLHLQLDPRRRDLGGVCALSRRPRRGVLGAHTTPRTIAAIPAIVTRIRTAGRRLRSPLQRVTSVLPASRTSSAGARASASSNCQPWISPAAAKAAYDMTAPTRKAHARVARIVGPG